MTRANSFIPVTEYHPILASPGPGAWIRRQGGVD
jgi:hypothetical protein